MQNYINTLKQEIGLTSAGENPKETKRGTKKACQLNWVSKSACKDVSTDRVETSEGESEL